jgi:hypothetical protein
MYMKFLNSGKEGVFGLFEMKFHRDVFVYLKIKGSILTVTLFFLFKESCLSQCSCKLGLTSLYII